MFYTRSNGMRVPSTVVGFAPDGLLHLEYFQDAVKVVNRQCKVESISFAIPSAQAIDRIVCKVRRYLNLAVDKVHGSDRLNRFNHNPHFPYLMHTSRGGRFSGLLPG